MTATHRKMVNSRDGSLESLSEFLESISRGWSTMPQSKCQLIQVAKQYEAGMQPSMATMARAERQLRDYVSRDETLIHTSRWTLVVQQIMLDSLHQVQGSRGALTTDEENQHLEGRP